MIWTYVCGDLERTINFPHLFSPGFMVFCKSLFCLCICSTFSWEDWWSLFLFVFSLLNQVVLLCSCVLAFFLNYCIFLNTTLNSAVTQTICGNMKVGFTSYLSFEPKKKHKCDTILLRRRNYPCKFLFLRSFVCYDSISESRSFEHFNIIVAGRIHGWTRLDVLWWTPIRLGMFFTIPYLLQWEPKMTRLHLLQLSVVLIFVVVWFVSCRWMWLDSFLVSSDPVYMHTIRSLGGKQRIAIHKQEWPLVMILNATPHFCSLFLFSWFTFHVDNSLMIWEILF